LYVQYSVQSIPTLLIFKDGQVVEQAVGALSKADLQGMLDSHA
jgi:thioredoxin 1